MFIYSEFVGNRRGLFNTFSILIVIHVTNGESRSDSRWRFATYSEKSAEAKRNRFDEAWRLHGILVLMDKHFIHNDLERCQKKEKGEEISWNWLQRKMKGSKWVRAERWNLLTRQKANHGGSPWKPLETPGNPGPIWLWQLCVPGFSPTFASFHSKSLESRTHFLKHF